MTRSICCSAILALGLAGCEKRMSATEVYPAGTSAGYASQDRGDWYGGLRQYPYDNHSFEAASKETTGIRYYYDSSGRRYYYDQMGHRVMSGTPAQETGLHRDYGGRPLISPPRDEGRPLPRTESRGPAESGPQQDQEQGGANLRDERSNTNRPEYIPPGRQDINRPDLNEQRRSRDLGRPDLQRYPTSGPGMATPDR